MTRFISILSGTFLLLLGSFVACSLAIAESTDDLFLTNDSPFLQIQDELQPFVQLAEASPNDMQAPTTAAGRRYLRLHPQEKDYVLPAFEIVFFQAGLNLFNRNFASDSEDYESDAHSISDNLHSNWQVDRDSFDINQLGHPYQGSIYYVLARSSGLNFWESFGYATVGSAVWEIAGETTKPSLNDQITTSIGGSFLGEALFRTAGVFFASADRTDSTTTEVSGAIASPAAEVNRLAFDKKVSPDLTRQRPALFREMQLGYYRNVNVFNPYDQRKYDRNAGLLRFNIEYGLPGQPGYQYEQPFDYYNLDAAVSTSGNDNLEHLLVNGLIVGEKYEVGSDVDGIFGLYGNYNYIAPEIFRVAGTALSLGSTAQWSLAKDVALQGTLLGGVGFGAAGTMQATDGTRDYHYGAIPQGQVALRLIAADRVMLSLSGLDFFVTDSSSGANENGKENISRVQLALTLRVQGPHALRLDISESNRNAPFDNTPDQRQRVETIGVYYTYLWDASAWAGSAMSC